MLRRSAIVLAVCLAGIMGLRAQDYRTLLQESGGSLSVYNNIVVNNGDTTNNYPAWAAYNLFGYHPDIFSHIENDFSPLYHPLLFNRGYNTVVLWPFDLQGNMRVANDTVELGAFEYPRIIKPYELGYPLYQMPGSSLNICNNIIINNSANTNVNVSVSAYNLVTDSVEVFLHVLTDYRIKPASLADNTGDNSCVNFGTDLKGEVRVAGAAVELGAFERLVGEVSSIAAWPVYVEDGGNLNLCNNIIINNSADSNVNVSVSAYNLVNDTADVFFHYLHDYRIKPESLADNAGDNNCVDFSFDMKGEDRVAGAAVELGAFERLVGVEQNLTAWPVYVEDGGSLNLCNNIIINNSADSNVNVSVSAYNLENDSVDVFLHYLTDYRIKPDCLAENTGDNSCVSFGLDMKDDYRIYGDIVDIGAFERPVEITDWGFPFYQELGADGLNLCNNIIINNIVDSNINIVAPPYNMVENSHNVFMDDQNNFMLQPYSSAVDGGLNACATWNQDLRDSTRIIHEVIDLGAFEVFVDYSNAIVYQDAVGTLTLCNNVVILNSGWTPNTNIQHPSSDNIFNDQVEVFRDNMLDFRPMQHSDAVDAGNNGCNSLPTDLDTVKRISNGRIDIGAFEIPEWNDTNNYASGGGGGGGGGYELPTYNAIVYEESSASLYLCDNIIVNGLFTANTNTAYGLNPQYCNWVKDTVGIFREPDYDFRLNPISPVINKGRNDCNTLPIDVAMNDRIQQDTIDIGAFEYIPPTEPVALEQVEGYQMTVCNNIIINNVEVFSVNDMNTSGHNLLVDNNYVFKNNELDYTLREHCAAVNAGVNTCCSLVTDLNEAHRIIWDTIDYGAFELNRLSDSTTFTVWEEEGHQLQLCNNIIINNGGSFAVSDANVSGSNLLVDHDDVFRHNVTDYRLRENSIAVNAGVNECCTLAVDINDEDRIFADTIDYGAFEQSVSLDDSVYAVQQVEGHLLQLCNNIIINNSIAQATNVETVEANNLITDNEEMFVDSWYDYSPRLNSAAVNQGSNDCCPLSVDITQQPRVYEEVIDIGAFEPRFEWDTAIALLGEDGASLVLCNNIIINNKYAKNLNVLNVPANNIVEDNDTLFMDNCYNFRVRSGSLAVNHGSNDCVGWMLDLEENPRIFEEIVDIGAYEQYFENGILTAVLDGDTGGLVLCNNIIINNKYAQNVNVENVPVNNIVTDNDTLFRNRIYDYTPRANSSAINRGDNDCADWAKDIATESRVFAEIIDIGAYELALDTVVELYAVNTTDDDGGGDEPGTGGGDSPGTGGSDSIANALKLHLYNNIVIYNAGHTMNVGDNIIGDHNLLEDIPNVFVDEQDTFLLKPQSLAIDAGDNQWVAWATDIKDDPRIACASIVDQGAYEHQFTAVELALTATMVETENCQGYYFELTATEGAQHYYWSHGNEDTNVVQVSPLIPTEYTVIATSGGECADTASVYVVPLALMSDSLGAPASVGTTFWLSYLRNHFRKPTLTLNVSAEEACTGTVSNPRTGWSTTFSVGNHSVTTVSVPLNQAYPSASDAVGDFGLLVETTDSVSLYAANYNVSSFDVTDVLPVNALSDEYVLQTYTPMMNAEFVIVATEDSTLVDITPSRALQGGHPAQQTFSVMLHQGQTYLGMSQYGGVLGDLSGTLIHAHGNKPVAVFNGNVCALVPANNSYTDHLVEQAVGVNYWGRSFTISSTATQNYDMVRVTALRDNTEVLKNGVMVATLQAYQTHEFQLSGTEGSCFIETSQPAGVYLYIAGAMQGNSQERSDPSMIWIPPTEQMLNDITFATFNSPGISDHYVNIVVPAAAVDEVTLDGIHIGGQFTLVNGNSAYAFARRHITNGTHTLHCNGGFIAHCYGLGFHESYGYAAGSKAVPLKEQLFVNGILNTEMPADTRFCPYEPITFSTYVNYPCDSVVWNFGDGSATVNATETVHSYADPGTYVVAATLYITSNGAVFCSNLYARVRVQAGPVLTIEDTVCQGDVYQQYGFDISADVSGHFSYVRSVAISGQYCDSTYILELEVLDNYLIVEDTICVNNHYAEYGFNIVPTEIGIYSDTLNAGAGANGCDSLVILQLTVTPNTDNPPAIEGEGWPCQGGSYTYAIDSLAGLQDVVWTVPDSVIVLSQQDPFLIELLFDTYADSMEICVSAMGGCGELHWCRMIYPQPYNFVQITDTLCEGVTEYSGYGFELSDISDTNDLFYHYDVAMGGCDSTTVLSLVFVPTYEIADTIIICESEFPYPYHDTLLADTGFYQITLYSEFGCDSVVNLTIGSQPVHHTDFYDTVCDVKNWYDSIYALSGDYDMLLTNVYGCDSLVTMHLTVNYSDTVAVDSAVCRNDLPIYWNNLTFEEEGVQTVTLENIHGCDSIVVMTLQVKELSEDSINVYVLENELPTYSLNGYSYDSSGVYTQILVNAVGCDSILTVNFTVLNNVSGTADSTICENMLPFTWNDVLFTDAGTQFAVLTGLAVNGADSIVVMNVEVIPTTYGTFDTAIIENNLPLLYNDSTYAEAGTYTQYLTNAAGCDSVLAVVIDVYPNVTSNLDSAVCESELPFTWNDSMFTEAGTKTTTILATTGADSTITMTLTVIPTTYGTFDTAIIENNLPLLYNDSTYAEAGTYTQYLPNAAGCDSVLTVVIDVYPNVTSNLDSAVCENAFPFIWNDSVFTGAGTKTTTILASTGADSTITMTLTVTPTTYGTFATTIVENALPFSYNDSTYAEAGTYAQYLTNAADCDSVLTVVIDVYPNVTSNLDSAVCESELPFTWNDSVFTEAGTKTTTILATTGADSTITMTLTVTPTTYGIFATTIVENALPFSYNDSTYAEAGTYIQHLTSSLDCDSILTVNLTVLPNVTVSVYDTICVTDLPFTWNDSIFTEAGTKTRVFQTADGVDSTVLMTLYVNPLPVVHITGQTVLCANSAVTLCVDSAVSYLWNTGDTTQCVAVSETGEYSVTVADSNGCTNTVSIQIESFGNPIVNVTFPEMCAGSSYTVSVGDQPENNILLGHGETTLSMSDTIFLPDGIYCEPHGCSYRSPLTFTAYADNAVIQSVQDIYYVKLNIEHSFIGDLYINITCPNGQKADLMKYGGTGTSECNSSILSGSRGWNSGDNLPWAFFGMAEDYAATSCNPSEFGNEQGIGWNYCWSDNTSQGYTYAPGEGSRIYRSEHVHYNIVDSSNVTAGTNFYHPDDSFTNLIGCPLNGDWFIEVQDGWNDDNGYIFGWELALSTEALPEMTFEYDSTIVDGPWVTTLGDSLFELNPPADLEHDTVIAYTFSIYDINGCVFDTTVNITFHAQNHTEWDTVTCDSFYWNGQNYTESGDYTQILTNAEGCDSVVTVHLTLLPDIITEVDSTICANLLPLTWNDSVFSTSDTKTAILPTNSCVDSIVVMTLHVLPPSTAVITGLTALCGDSVVTLTADSAFSYRWSTGDTTRSIAVAEEGFYTLTVTDEYGCEAEATHYLSSLGNPILSVTVPNMCAGGSYTLSVGHQDEDNIQLGHGETTLSISDTIYLPDGVYCDPHGCSYRSPLTFTAYADDATIQSVEDIYYVRLNIEHSFIGDLYINITCPNGQKADLMKYGGSGNSSCNSQIEASSRGWAAGTNMSVGTFFGAAYDYNVASCDATAFGNEPGIGWNYCWSDNTTQGYGYAQGNDGLIYRSGNSHNGIVDSSNVAAGTQFYHPDDPFTNLIGCPLNGDWYIEVQDGWNQDNGYIFGWELALSSEALPDVAFELDYSTADGPWLTTLSDTLFQITPPAILEHDTTVAYTFTVYDTIGCGYDTTVNITFYAIRHTDMDTTVCESFTWNDSVYTASGQYVQTFTSEVGCDSIVTVNLIVNTKTYGDTTAVACESFTWHGVEYTVTPDVAPTYTITDGNHNGCDSIVTLHLTVNHKTYGDTTVVACESYTWHGVEYTSTPAEAPTYTMTGGNHNGCDSIVILHLTVNHKTYGDTTAVDCESFIWHGVEYTETPTMNPTYTITGGNHSGCDSIVTLHLTVNHGTHNVSEETVCEGYEWHGETYTESDTYTYAYTNANGCPSVDTLHLTVHYGTHNVTDTAVCESCEWNGTAYTESGTYTHVYTNADDCPSADTLHLTVSPMYEFSFEDVICEGEVYNGHGFEVPSSQTVGVSDVSLTQSLQSQSGCDSLVHLSLTVIDTSLRIIPLTEDFCESSSMELMVETAMEDYVWSTGEDAPTITVMQAGIYGVTATQGGCQATAHINVEECHYELYLPNAITPSRGDGLNDYFSIPEVNRANMVIFEIAIYNRWGELVFYSKDKNFRWNGEYRGQIYYETIYNYVIRYTDTIGKPYVRTGSITIL